MKTKTLKSKKGISKNDICDIYLIDADEKTARSIIASLGKTEKKLAVLGRDSVFNRRVLETLKLDYLISPEVGDKKDTLKQRDSGLNHVLAKIAKEKNVGIVIDFKDIQKLKGKGKALRLARVIQNIKICRKAGCKIKIWDFSGKTDEKALKAFGFSLGMSSGQVGDKVLLF